MGFSNWICSIEASALWIMQNKHKLTLINVQWGSGIDYSITVNEKNLYLLFENWMVLFVCLWILVPLKNFSLKWRHLFLPRAAKFNLCSALMAIEQWGFFSMPHLTWHGASMYNGPVTFTPIAEPLAVELFLLWTFIWTNLNSLHPRKLCAKFGWNWPSGSGEEEEDKRPRGHIAHLRKPLKSINIYDYIIWLREEKEPLLTLWEFNGSSFE